MLHILERYIIAGFWGGGGGESEGTVGLLLDMTTTRSGLPTDIYRSVFISNCWHFTFIVDTVATFVVTLEKGFITAVCTKEV
jgi:hypothetical protein